MDEKLELRKLTKRIIILLGRVIIDSYTCGFISFITSPLGNILFFFQRVFPFAFLVIFSSFCISIFISKTVQDSIIYLCKLLSKIIIILLIMLSAKFALTLVKFATDITPFPAFLTKHQFQPKSSASARINHFIN